MSMQWGFQTSFHSERGLSLIEVLCAAVILGIAVIAFSYMFGAAGADIVQMGNERVCIQIAQQEMERLVGLPYEDSDLSVGRHYRRFRRPPAPTDVDLDGDLFVEWRVTLHDDPYGNGQDYKEAVVVLYDDLLDNDLWAPGNDPVVNDPRERVATLITLIAP